MAYPSIGLLHRKRISRLSNIISVKVQFLHYPLLMGTSFCTQTPAIYTLAVRFWQIQDGFPRLIGYASKTLPPAAANYSVTELEMTGLLMNIHAWRGWTQGAEVDVAVDHKAVVQILKSKELPATGHIGLLIRKLGPLPFNLYYVKGKDLVLTDFLSWIRSDDSDPSKVLPISFVDMQMMDPPPEYKFQIRTCSSAKCEGATVPPVHGIEKGLDPHKNSPIRG